MTIAAHRQCSGIIIVVTIAIIAIVTEGFSEFANDQPPPDPRLREQPYPSSHHSADIPDQVERPPARRRVILTTPDLALVRRFDYTRGVRQALASQPVRQPEEHFQSRRLNPNVRLSVPREESVANERVVSPYDDYERRTRQPQQPRLPPPPPEVNYPPPREDPRQPPVGHGPPVGIDYDNSQNGPNNQPDVEYSQPETREEGTTNVRSELPYDEYERRNRQPQHHSPQETNLRAAIPTREERVAFVRNRAPPQHAQPETNLRDAIPHEEITGHARPGPPYDVPERRNIPRPPSRTQSEVNSRDLRPREESTTRTRSERPFEVPQRRPPTRPPVEEPPQNFQTAPPDEEISSNIRSEHTVNQVEPPRNITVVSYRPLPVRIRKPEQPRFQQPPSPPTPVQPSHAVVTPNPTDDYDEPEVQPQSRPKHSGSSGLRIEVSTVGSRYDEDSPPEEPPHPPAPSTTTTTTEATPGRRPFRKRQRGGQRRRSTTSTTTTPAPDDYEADYYDDEYDDATTTTTTKRPKRRRNGNRRSRPRLTTEASTTTTTTVATTTKALSAGYKQRPDGRIIDFNSDPNFPFELKGEDLTNYPFYISIPDDVKFNCRGRHDGYYASIQHHCQVRSIHS